MKADKPASNNMNPPKTSSGQDPSDSHSGHQLTGPPSRVDNPTRFVEGSWSGKSGTGQQRSLVQTILAWFGLAE